MSESLCSCDRFFELSAKGDKINEKLSQSLPSNDTANVLRMTNDAVAKPPRGFGRES
jgi:hypothetical protein